MDHRRSIRTLSRLAIAAALMASALMLAACGTVAGERTGGEPAVGTVAPSSPAPIEQRFSGASKDAAQFGAADGVSRENLATAPAVSATRLIVVNKTMRIEAEDVDAAIAKIRDLAKRDGADISSMQVSTAVDEPIYREPVPMTDGGSSASSAPLRAYVTVRVPTERYAAFIADAAKLGRVLTESETADDVTQQNVDMKARLGNLEAEQKRLRQLFAKATTVRDMLAIEQELTRVQGEIESMRAQIDYLQRQAARATVTLELTEPAQIIQPSGIDWGVRTAFTDSVRAFVSTMNGLIVLLGPVLALAVFLGVPVALIAWIVVRISRRRSARIAAATERAAAESADTDS